MINLEKGTVTSNIDGYHKGRFKAEFPKYGEREIIYTSPMYRVNGGGFLAIPSEGDIILAAYDDTDEKWYYHSTVVDVELLEEDRRIPNFKEITGSQDYSKDSKPVSVKMQNQVGAGLDITRNFRPVPMTAINYVNLVSERGKKVGLDDSPGVEAVVIQNQHGDGVLVKGETDNYYAGRSINVKSVGPQSFHVANSYMNLKVQEGQDLTIENKSTGAMAQRPSEQYWPNGKQPCRRWGGIYLRSENGDVSIAANADSGNPEEDGRIFITTPKARIQILQDGSITLDSTDSIKIRTDGNLNMEGQDVNIKANGSLNIQSSSDASISSGGNVNANGQEIHLNSPGKEVSVPSLGDHSNNDLNDYNE